MAGVGGVMQGGKEIVEKGSACGSPRGPMTLRLDHWCRDARHRYRRLYKRHRKLRQLGSELSLREMVNRAREMDRESELEKVK